MKLEGIPERDMGSGFRAESLVLRQLYGCASVDYDDVLVRHWWWLSRHSTLRGEQQASWWISVIH